MNTSYESKQNKRKDIAIGSDFPEVIKSNQIFGKPQTNLNSTPSRFKINIKSTQ